MMKLRTLLSALILVYVVLFAFMTMRSLNLEFNGELTALLPQENNHIDTYNKLSQLNSSEGGFEALIHSKEDSNVIESAQEITNLLLKLELDGHKVFKNAELENDLYNIRYSALYLMSEEELDSAYNEISNYVEEEKLKANPVYIDFSEEEPDAEEELTMSTESSVLLNDLANSDRYRINTDSSIIKVLFIPDFAKSDYNKVEQTYQLLQAKSTELESVFPSIEVFWDGSYISHYHKINDVQYAILKALIIGTLSLVLFLVFYMLYANRGVDYKKRYILADLLLIFFTLFSGFIISLGISSFVFDEINVFTGIIFSILFGINLDYILHVYSINKETGIDLSNIKRVGKSYLSSSRPIILSCLTTGLSIMSLVFTDFKGFKQFGLIFFINIIVNLFATYIFLFLSQSVKDRESTSERTSQSGISSLLDFYFTIGKNKKRVSLLSFLVIIGITGYLGMQSLAFNFSFSDLEPKSARNAFDELSGELQKGDRNHDPSFFLADDIAESKLLFDHIKNGLDSTYTDIAKVESFSARYPITEAELMAKEKRIKSLQNLIDINEQYIIKSDGIDFIDIVENTVPPNLDSLPKYIRNRFLFQDNSVAPMVIVYPAMSLSNGERSINFRKSSGSIQPENGKTYHAASTYIIASSILELLINEYEFLLMVPMLTICVLLLVNYRSIKDMGIAIAPLVITFLVLLSLKNLLQFQINLYNVIVIPIIIGVGADNGIHLVDSMRKYGKGFFRPFITQKYPVLAACSVTTILGFIGLLFINHPGMESVGWLAVVGILVTLFGTILAAIFAEAFSTEREDSNP
ncbi:MAG: MMPL family transporter [Balneola sp.]